MPENLNEGPIARVLPGYPNANERKLGGSPPKRIITIKDQEEIADAITEGFLYNFQSALDQGDSNALEQLRTQYPGQYNCALVLTVDKLAEARTPGTDYEEKGRKNLEYMRRLPGFDAFVRTLMSAQFDLASAPSIQQFIRDVPNSHIGNTSDTERLEQSVNRLGAQELSILNEECRILKDAEHIDLVIGLKARMATAFAGARWAQCAQGMKAGALARINFDIQADAPRRANIISMIRRISFFNDVARNTDFL